MKTFEELQAGDILYYVKSRLRLFDNKSVKSWGILEITKVTKAFYYIGDKKFRKDANGKGFLVKHFIPGHDEAPLFIDEDQEDENFRLISEANKKVGWGRKILDLQGLDIFSAAKFAEELDDIEERIKHKKESLNGSGI